MLFELKSRFQAPGAVLILTGYGIRVFVERGHLCFEDGAGRHRRSGRLPRIGHDLKRVVVLGHAGNITFEALRWLHDVGAAFIQIDHDGQLISCTSPPGLDDARLRRAQAMARSSGLDLEISRSLIRQKLLGQLQVVKKLRDSDSAAQIGAIIEKLSPPQTIDSLRMIEAQAAIIYWKAWELIGVIFVQKDKDRVPEHWLEFGGRASLVTGNPRKATNPISAILNYLYSILESEARIAALSMGLDPGIGLMHADQRSRDSLACDLMEPVRPKVDSFVLDFLKNRAFKKIDFFETREGICRVMPSVSRELMTTGPIWAKELGPVVEHVALTLFDSKYRPTAGDRKSLHTIPTVLTQANRTSGRAALRVQGKER
jgi:CRISPR-associated endonuclease Cas1